MSVRNARCNDKGGLTVFEAEASKTLWDLTSRWRKLHIDFEQLNRKAKVKLTLEQATKAQRGSRVIALLFL